MSKNLAIDGKDIKKLSRYVEKTEQKKVDMSKFKKELPLSKIETKQRGSLGLSNWQKKTLHKFSAKKLKEKNMAWVPKVSFQAQYKDDV